MDDALFEAFRAAAYHVNLDTVSWATIRVDLPLPTDLLPLVGSRSWAFITAWNPQARRRSPAENLAAQSELLAELQSEPDAVIRPAIGVGSSGWIEPSLFCVGPAIATLDRLAKAHGQLAYVHGEAGGAALLRILG